MNFNESQKAAIAHVNGPMLVLAGPGSGKTAVIAERTRHLTQRAGIPEEDILVVTFTKAAALEMKARYMKISGISSTRVNFGTFHSIFFRMLRAAYHFTPDQIAADDVRNAIALKGAEQLGIEMADQGEFLRDFFGDVGIVKNDLRELSEYDPASTDRKSFVALYRYYEETLHSMGKMDFDDILVYCLELLQAREDIRNGWKQRFRYILVDEFQDVNLVQYKVLQLLSGRCGNLFVVGDDDQSIYRFRGARPDFMLGFEKDYDGCKRVLLDHNYRSQQYIVERAMSLISYNNGRFDKKIIPVRPKGKPVELMECRTLTEEVRYALNVVRNRHKEGMAYKDMAFIFRTSLEQRPFVDKMMEYQIPFELKEGLPDIYSHWIAKDLMAYVRLAQIVSGSISGGMDKADFLRVMNRPNRYISRDSVVRIQLSFENLRLAYKEKDWMLERLDEMEAHLRQAANLMPFAALHYICNVIGYGEYLEAYAASHKIPVDDLKGVYEEILEDARSIKDFDAWFSHIDAYQAAWKEKTRNVQRTTKSEDAVAFLTMHASKGLEYKLVFVFDVNEGFIPHKKAGSREELEEERRLFYVAMTRAKDELILCSPKERYERDLEPSRFLGELTVPLRRLHAGEIFRHSQYGRCEVLSVDGDKAQIRIQKDNRKVVIHVPYCLKHNMILLEDQSRSPNRSS